MGKQFVKVFSSPRSVLIALGIVLVFGSAIWVAQRLTTSDPFRRQEDIYFTYVEGNRLINGTNPYSRIHAGNMRDNDKYATYFPGLYLLSAGVQALGVSEPKAWLALWRTISALFMLAIGALVFIEGHRRYGALFAFFCIILWFFNRWTINVIQSANTDFMAIFFFLVSLALFDKNRNLALVLFGVSLTVKQMAIFALPLYLIWIWKSSPAPFRRREMMRSALMIAAVPLACSLPFLIWDAIGFIESILFSATRRAAGFADVKSIEALLGWSGLAGRIPMLAIFAIFYVEAARRGIGRYASAMFIMLTFTLMSPVLFKQYFCWVVPLIPLAICEAAAPDPEPVRSEA